MEKIRLFADSPSDIPDDLLGEYGVEMPCVPIAVDGKSCIERKSFSIPEFYRVLAAAKEIPATSRVPASDYVALYKKAWEDGCTDVVNVTINAGGSGTHDSASMAVELFYAETPQARETLRIHLVDSKTYSMGYGYPVLEAARMARDGRPVREILAYLEDFFGRLELYLVCYTLEYARRSGRITAASAVVGDMLGIRPVIAMIDGWTKTVEKVRGDKGVPARLLSLYRRRCGNPEDLVCIIYGEEIGYALELQELLRKETGRQIPCYRAGASIVINSGPRIVALCFLGKRRSRPQ